MGSKTKTQFDGRHVSVLLGNIFAGLSPMERCRASFKHITGEISKLKLDHAIETRVLAITINCLHEVFNKAKSGKMFADADADLASQTRMARNILWKLSVVNYVCILFIYYALLLNSPALLRVEKRSSLYYMKYAPVGVFFHCNMLVIGQSLLKREPVRRTEPRSTVIHIFWDPALIYTIKVRPQRIRFGLEVPKEPPGSLLKGLYLCFEKVFQELFVCT